MKDTLDTAVAECMDVILQKVRKARVSFHFVEGPKSLCTDHLIYAESRKHKLFFHYAEQEPEVYQIYEKLDLIEQKLSGYGFLRLHKSYLVNMRHIRKISNYTAFLDTGEEISIPRVRYRAVKEEFVAYKGFD